MKQNLFILLLFFISVFVYSDENQSDKEINSNDIKFYFIIEPNIIFPEQITGSINFLLSFNENVKGNIDGVILHGPVLGFETNFMPYDYAYGIKIGYHFDFVHFLGICFRVNSIMYNDNEKWDIRIQPEIGISILGQLGITYGYNFSLFENKNNVIGNHRIILFYRIVLLGCYKNKDWRFFPMS